MEKVKKIIKNICIVDWFLMLFMLILFFYMIFHLFTGIEASQEIHTIDVIVRSSMAAIFGYFISSNFSRVDVSITQQSTDHPTINLSSESEGVSDHDRIQNQIGFQSSAAAASEELGTMSFSESSSTSARYCNEIQVFVVSMIGLISLIILLITRHFQNVTPELTAVISQLRDFVSACIGFLVSCGKK